MTAECFRCGTAATTTFGNGYLCDECLSAADGDARGEDEPEGATENTVDVETVPTDATGEIVGDDVGLSLDEWFDREQWMCRVEKKPFAPWANSDAGEAYPDLDTDEDPRWKWKPKYGHWRDGWTAHREAAGSIRVDGVAYLMQPDDPVLFADGDNVVCPETGDRHPAWEAFLAQMAPTFVGPSSSGTGDHAVFYCPEGFPDDAESEPVLTLDDEAWGANDDPPKIELYAGTKVMALTGEQRPGTPAYLGRLDDGHRDALRCWLEAHDKLGGNADRPNPTTVSVPDDYEPSATRGDETTDEIRDVLTAVNRLTVADLPVTIPTANGGDGDFTYHEPPYRPSDSGQSLHLSRDGTTFYDHEGGGSTFGALDWFAYRRGPLTDPRDPLTGAEWWETVDAARDAGAPIPEPEFDSDTEIVSAIPSRLETLTPDEQRRYLSKRGTEWPSSADVTERIREAVHEAMEDSDYTIVEAPTGANKTGIATETAWREIDDAVTGGRPTVVFCGTKDARDEAKERAEAAGRDPLVLFSRKELCDVAGGDYDPANIDDEDPDAPEPIEIEGQPASEWIDTMCDKRGVPFSVVHSELEYRLNRQGRACPCCEGEYRCESQVQWPSGGLVDDDGVPRHDLVIATDPFAFVPSLRANTNVIHDEQPTYTEDFGLEDAGPDAVTSRVRRAVTAFLGLSDAGPDTFEGLVSLARRCAECDACPWNEHAESPAKPSDELADRWIETLGALGHDPERGWYFADDRAHTMAPALTRAIWKAIVDAGVDGQPGTGPFDGNGRTRATVRHEPPRLDEDVRDDDAWNRTYVSVVIDDTNTIRQVRNAPDFSTARSVIGLDARPTPWLWQRNVHPDMTTDRVLDPEERRLWRRFERGQTVVQVGDATRPAGRDGKYFTESHARALIERLSDHGDDDFRAVGCPSGFEDEIREIMRDAGVPEDEIASMHYGEEKSRNDFADELLGLVYGCIDPGDDYVLDLLAECGLDAEPERSETECDDCGGDGCHSCDGTGQKRAHGRGFTGPDADHAAELLESVRATHVAQMIGRFGRDLDVDEGERNITYVATDAVPDDLVDYHVEGVVSVATDLQREVIAELEERPSATTREIAEVVGCNKEHVRQTLADLEDRDDTVVQRARGVGSHGADRWRGENAPADDVQLRLDEIANGGVKDHSTWSLAIHRPGETTAVGEAGVVSAAPLTPATPDGDPPPNPGD